MDRPSDALRRYIARLRRPPRPKWSARSIAWLIGLTMALTIGVFCFVGPHSLLARAELVLLCTSAMLYAVLAVGLYRGVRVERYAMKPVAGGVSLTDAVDAASNSTPDTGYVDGLPVEVDSVESGCLAAILLLLAPLIWLGVVTAVVWLFSNTLLVAIPAVCVGFCFVLSRAIRRVMLMGRRCRGQRAPSLGWAGVYTTLYTGWLMVLLLACQWALHMRQ